MPTNEGDVYRFALVQKQFGQEIVNTFALKVETATDEMDESTFLGAQFNNVDGRMTDNISQIMREFQDQSLTHVKWTAQKVLPTVGALYEFSINQTGTFDSAPETCNTALCITRFGAGGGRRQRGRIALTGFPGNLGVEGKWGIGAKAAAETLAPKLYATYTAPLGIYTLSMGFFSPAHDGRRNNQIVHYDALYVKCVGAVVRDTVRVQRSRTVNVGS